MRVAPRRAAMRSEAKTRRRRGGRWHRLALGAAGRRVDQSRSLPYYVAQGGSVRIAISALALAFVTVLASGQAEAGDSSQIRIGGRLAPPIMPFYARLAFGFALDSDVRDVLGTDVVLGAG